MDMRFRGPGEVLGSRQSGLPDFTLVWWKTKRFWS